MVNGGAEVAQAFCRLPFDHLLFTGSTGVGRHVMRAAADNLTPVTLELGGKSPAIVGRGFPVAEAASRILFGKCLNAGQTCVAPDYVLVPEESVDAFVEARARAVASLYPTLAANPDYTAIVDDRHRERLARPARRRGGQGRPGHRDQPRRRGRRRGGQARPDAPRGRRRRDGGDARGDLRPAASRRPLPPPRRGHRLRERAPAPARPLRVRARRRRRRPRDHAAPSRAASR